MIGWTLAGEARVIRKTFYYGKNGRAKKAQDFQTGMVMERLISLKQRECGSGECSQPIHVYEEYVQLWPGGGGFERRSPLRRAYHPRCVPPESRPLLRLVDIPERKP